MFPTNAVFFTSYVTSIVVFSPQQVCHLLRNGPLDVTSSGKFNLSSMPMIWKLLAYCAILWPLDGRRLNLSLSLPFNVIGNQTVAFYTVLEAFPYWPRSALRTTSLLERVNRMIRRLFRPAAAYHSRAGLAATVARVLTPLLLF